MIGYIDKSDPAPWLPCFLTKPDNFEQSCRGSPKDHFFLSLLVSLKLEHYTRECEFGNFDEIKDKNNTKKNPQKTLG